MRCKGQGGSLDQQCYVVHEKEKSREKDAKAKAQLDKAKTQLCSLLWHSINYFAHSRHGIQFWEKKCALYTNNIYRFHESIYQMTNLKRQNFDVYLLG